MIVEVNGEKTELQEGVTVTQLLASLNLPSTRVAVEKNATLVPRAEHPSTQLAAGDKIEIVHFVGGG